MNGWISLHRKVFENPIIKPSKPYSRFEAWCWLIIRANHIDNKFVLGNEIIKAGAGEVITSQKKLAAQFGWGNTKIRNFLKLLENDTMIDVKTTPKTTRISICNYSTYQDSQTKKKSKTTRKQHDSNMIATTINNTNNLNNSNNKNIKSEIFTELNLNKYGKRMLEVFHEYWIEPLQKNGKPKYTAEKAWSTGGRLATWSRNDFEGFYKAHVDEMYRTRHNKAKQPVYSDEEIATPEERAALLTNIKKIGRV